MSRWSTLSAPQFSVIPNERSLCALRLPFSEKQNEVKGNTQESLFKNALLIPAKILAEMRLLKLGFSS